MPPRQDEMNCAAADPAPRPPAFKVPAGAWDCHFHVFGPADSYAYAPERSYTPPDASVGEYLHLRAVLGLQRGVVVQPSVYGTDNRRTLSAMAELGPGMRGVVVLDEAASEADLAAMHDAGVRGVRLNLLFRGGLSADAATRIAHRVRELGWHVQLLVDVSAFANLEAFVHGLGVPAVFDHMGHLPAGKGIADPGFAVLLALLRDEAAWVKLSGAYRLTELQHPPYEDVDPIARALLDAHPGRCVWGTDWPHPAIRPPMPNDGDLMDLLWRWTGDDAMVRQILVDNPAALYGA